MQENKELKKALKLTCCAPKDPAECVLIEIIATISIDVSTGCIVPHCEVGTKSRHMKTS